MVGITLQCTAHSSHLEQPASLTPQFVPKHACSAKLDAMECKQGELAATVGDMRADVAAQGSALQGIGKACSQLLQVGEGPACSRRRVGFREG